MLNSRFLTKEDREKIKKKKEEERVFNNYLAGAVDRMTPRPQNYRVKIYNDQKS